MSKRLERRQGSSGQSLALFAVVLIGLMWVMALGIDAAQMMLRHREMQSVADLATLAGARSLGEGTGDATSRACAVAVANGYSCPGEAVVTFPASDQIQVTVSRPVSTFFLGIFGVSSVNASAPARAKGVPQTSSGYAIFAGNSTCGSDAELTLDWSGSDVTVNGGVHSNGSIKMGGSGNDVIGTTTTVCSTFSQGSNTFTPPPTTTTIQSYPVPPGGYTRSDFTCTFGSHTGGDIDLGSSSTHFELPGVLKTGTWCSGGLIKIGSSSLSGNITLVADKLELSGSSTSFTPHQKNVLLFALGTGDSVIKVNGSNINWSGYVYAPYGQVEYSGSTNNTLTGSIIGYKVKLNGSTLTINALGGGTPMPPLIRLVE